PRRHRHPRHQTPRIRTQPCRLMVGTPGPGQLVRAPERPPPPRPGPVQRTGPGPPVHPRPAPAHRRIRHPHTGGGRLMAEHVDITDEATLVAALRITRAQIAEQKEVEEALVSKLKTLLGDATEARIGVAPVAYYRRTKPREAVDVRALRKEHPDLARESSRLTPG